MKKMFLIIIFCVALLLPAFARANITTGLVGWWKMDDGAGTSTADSSGNGNTGSLISSPSWVTGKIGPYALSFNGSNYVQTNSSFGDGYSALTASAWVYSLNGNYAAAFVCKDDMANRSWYFGMNDSTSFKAALWTTTGRTDMIMSGFNLNQWNFVTFVYDGANMILYLNGVPSAPTAKTGTIVTASAPVAIGSINGNVPYYFTGSIDDVRIYNRALTQADVTQLYLYGSTGTRSGNYMIQSDAVAMGGGGWTSTNYIFDDTMGELSTGRSASTNYGVAAGYQEMQQSYITVSSPGDLTMLPSIPGISGGTADASGTYNVITDSPSGFNMKIKGSTNPAMLLSGDPTHYLSNYPTTPSYSWSVSSGNAQFGFTAEPATAADTAPAFLDNGSNTCGTGGVSGTNTCWAGFNSTNNTTIVNRTTRTDVSGEGEVIKFKAQSNNDFLISGDYNAGVTITVSTN